MEGHVSIVMIPDETPLEDVDLPLRARHALMLGGCKTVGDVRKIKDRELMRFPNCGRTTLAHIREVIPMALPDKSPSNGDIIETVIAKGDLSKLTPEERVRYYNETCKSLGLNPLTQPFQYITLKGALRLYGTRAAADQLRKIHGVSTTIVSQEYRDDFLSIHVRARTADGREDEDLGVVYFPPTLKAEERANTVMKAITKAKRRVTMSICGLGFLDETEVEDIPRENPHVTRPEDVVDVPAADHPDRIPAGDPTIKPLPRKNARADFSKLQQEMHATTDPDELNAWGKDNANRIATQPTDWQDILRGLYIQHMLSLRNQPQTSWLEELQKAYATCKTAEEIFKIDLRFSATMPPDADKDRADDIRAEYLKALENE